MAQKDDGTHDPDQTRYELTESGLPCLKITRNPHVSDDSTTINQRT